MCFLFFWKEGLWSLSDFQRAVVPQSTKLLELVDQLGCSWLQTKENPLQTGRVSVFMHHVIRILASFLCTALGFTLLVCWLCPLASLSGGQTPAIVPGPMLLTTVQKEGVSLLFTIQKQLTGFTLNHS